MLEKSIYPLSIKSIMIHNLNGMSFFAKTKQGGTHSPRKLQLVSVNFLGFEYPPRYFEYPPRYLNTKII